MLIVAGRAEALQGVDVATLCGVDVTEEHAVRGPTARRVVHLGLEGVEDGRVGVRTANEVVGFIAHRLDRIRNFRIDSAAVHRGDLN